MSPGPSSDLTKSVVEVFAPRFMKTPAVLWISESKDKVVARDDQLATALGLQIAADRNLPDVILVDLGDREPDNVLIAFIEIVVTDGAMTAQRQEALLKLATDAGFPRVSPRDSPR